MKDLTQLLDKADLANRMANLAFTTLVNEDYKRPYCLWMKDMIALTATAVRAYYRLWHTAILPRKSSHSLPKGQLLKQMQASGIPMAASLDVMLSRHALVHRVVKDSLRGDTLSISLSSLRELNPMLALEELREYVLEDLNHRGIEIPELDEGSEDRPTKTIRFVTTA